MGCGADVEVLVFIGKAHRHSVAMVFFGPGIDMGILQDVVTHLSFISYKYHIYQCRFHTISLSPR